MDIRLSQTFFLLKDKAWILGRQKVKFILMTSDRWFISFSIYLVYKKKGQFQYKIRKSQKKIAKVALF